ncbi:MAG: histidine--tRNA ligase, partial [Deltaproteobacteria bacterium]|nr:histidine--tRNA ligase [Deltaproteobacteria bacterium]
RSVAERYGFVEIRTPIVEKTALFTRTIGAATAIVEKEMYTFADQSEESLTLRPEGTAPVVRAYVESEAAQHDPIAKYYYLGPMFRRERPQKGRYRQFHQFGVESLGALHPYADVEAIALLLSFLGDVGLTRLRLEINSLGCTTCRPGYLQMLSRMVAKVGAELCADCRRRATQNPLRLFDCKNPDCQKVLAELPTITEYLCNPCRNHFAAVTHGLDSVAISYVHNPRIARGLDYYVRTAFEVIAEGLGAQNAIGGGGRYDGLVKHLGGPDVPGIGFAVGLERVMLLCQERAAAMKKTRTFVAAIGEAARAQVLTWIERWRRGGCAVEWDIDGRSLKSQMRRADKIGAAKVIIIGDEELKTGKAIVRDMLTKTQHAVPFDDLPSTVQS